jgi:hypothetical protein
VPLLSTDVVVDAQLVLPLVASFVVHEAVTLLTYQPFAPGVPESVPFTSGAEASRLALTLFVVELPAASVAVQVYVVPALSVDVVVVAQPADVVPTPDMPSFTANETFTSLVYQPFAPSVPLTVGVMVGPVASRFADNVAVAERPAPFVAVHV